MHAVVVFFCNRRLGSTVAKKDGIVLRDGELTLIRSDVSAALELIDDSSVQLVVTSPPYNIGKSYERDIPMSLDEYIDWLTPIIQAICRKVVSNGSICWQVGNFVRNSEVFPLDYYFYEIFRRNGMKLRNRVIWRFNFGLHATKRLSGRYETLLWLTKSDSYTFNLDRIRVPQLYPGKRHSSRKGTGKAGKPSGNPLGKNPADFWTFSAEDCFVKEPVWEIPNVKANHPEQTIHPCQFPHELAQRCVLAFSNPGDAVLDPFVGAGTTAVAAIGAGRKSIGIDKSKEYIELTRARVHALRNGTLKLRNSGLSVQMPSLTQAVTQVPLEWVQAAE
jgi:DNA modification methylase